MNLPFVPWSPVTCQLGESPVWDERRNALFLCDIPNGLVFRVILDTGAVASWRFAEPVGSLGLARSGRLVVAAGRSVLLFDPEREEATPVCEVEPRAGMRLNDGKVGPDGAFWVGSMDEAPERRPIGRLYRVAPDGAVTVKVEDLRTPNGLAFSPDGRSLYQSDSRGPWIDRWQLDAASGEIDGRERFATPDEASGRPDGGATDAEGCYWSAGISAGRLNRFDEGGRLVASQVLPVAAPTMPCFGGPGLGTLFVTSLQPPVPPGSAASPLAGRLLSAASPVPGCPVGRFAD